MATTAVSYEKVKEDALHLPHEDRSRLASRLLESLDDEDDISPEWKDEIRRRVQEMKDGTAIMVPHEEVMANVRARLIKRREERATKIS
jgi:putative addiction module component (TIGR02574 family)